MKNINNIIEEIIQNENYDDIRDFLDNYYKELKNSDDFNSTINSLSSTEKEKFYNLLKQCESLAKTKKKNKIDEIEKSISVSPFSSIASNYVTKILKIINKNRLVFENSNRYNLIKLVIVIMLMLSAYIITRNNSGFLSIMLMSIILILSILNHFYGNDKIFFDKVEGYYYVNSLNKKSYANQIIPLNKIVAIQYLSIEKESRDVENNSINIYYIAEINLVLENERRVNILSHGDYVQAYSDAKTLSDFLKIPLWTYQERNS